MRVGILRKIKTMKIRTKILGQFRALFSPNSASESSAMPAYDKQEFDKRMADDGFVTFKMVE